MYIPGFRIKRNGVPILNKQEIDVIGEKLVRDFCPEAMETPMEIDIDSFIERYLGMTQDFQYLSHCGVYLGMTVFNDTSKIPVYNPNKRCAEYASAKARTVIIDSSLLDEGQEHRYRFTMGHEGGHDIFHSRYFGYDPNQLSFFDRGETPMIQCRTDIQSENRKPVEQWNDRDRMEWQANRLSSALLMPKSMVFKLIERLPSMEKLLRDVTYIMKVSKTFNVSSEAAKYRLLELGIVQRERSIRPMMGCLDIVKD
jgi:hypothetical protein